MDWRHIVIPKETKDKLDAAKESQYEPYYAVIERLLAKE